jgi:DNA-binding beta-propeller fold protein YncE
MHFRHFTTRHLLWRTLPPLTLLLVLVLAACDADEKTGGPDSAVATAPGEGHNLIARQVTTLDGATYGVAIGAHDELASMLWQAGIVRIRNGPSDLSARDVATGPFPVHGAFSPDGGTLYVVEQNGQALRSITIANGATTATDYGHSMFNIAVSPVDGMVFVTTGDGWLFKADPNTLGKLDSLALGGPSNGLAINANGFWVSTLTGALLRIDPGTLDLADEITLEGRPQRVAINASATTAYVANEGALDVQVVDLGSRTIRAIPVAGTPYGLALTPDDKTLWVAVRDAGRIDEYKTARMTRTGSLTIGGVPRNIAFSSNGRFALIGNESNSILVER